jgi:hypothetical protein
MASIHRHIKALLKEVGLEEGRRIRYPRKHSFVTLVKMCVNLGLLEFTGETADPALRGAGVVGVAGGFLQRHWLRLTPGAERRPEWHDPVGYYLVQYPETFAKMRKRGLSSGVVAAPPLERFLGRATRIPPVAPVQPVLVAPAPEPEPSRTREADTILPNLSGQHLELLELAIKVGSFGSLSQDFSDLLTKSRDFLVAMRQSFPRGNFRDFTEAVQILSTCGAALERFGQAGEEARLRGIAHCRSGANLVARELAKIDPAGLPTGEAPARGRRRRTPAAPAPTAPAKPAIPGVKLPQRPTAPAIVRLTTYLEQLQQLQGDDDEPSEELQEAMNKLVFQLADWEVEMPGGLRRRVMGQVGAALAAGKLQGASEALELWKGASTLEKR